MRVLGKNANVGERIRFHRTKRHMLVNTLAEEIGLSRYAIMSYENNQTEPLLEDLKKIAAVLGVESNSLYDDYYCFLDYPYSAKIKEMRKSHSLLQRELGIMLGVTRRAVERWEHGKNTVSRNTWKQLKDFGLL